METHINIENNGITDAEEYFKERLESKNKVLKAYPHKFVKSLEFDEYI